MWSDLQEMCEKQYTEGLMKQAFMPESQGYVFYCLHRKRRIALIGVKNIKTGLNINGTMFSLLMSRGLV